MAPGKCRAFTLTELLVVIAIIGLLASLMLAALSSARFRAGDAGCTRTLRQMGLALEMYATMFDAYPTTSSPVESQAKYSWYSWNMLLAQFLSPGRDVVPFGDNESTNVLDRSFLCPLLTRRQESPSPNGLAWESGYRYNTSGIGRCWSPLGLGGSVIDFPHFFPSRQSGVISPAEMIALGDPLTRSPDPGRDGSYDPTLMELRPQPPGGMVGGDARTGTNYRNHRNRYNRFLCDGHVEMEDCDKPFRDTDEYLARWNIDHEPHRDWWKW